jgi:transposase
MPKEIETPRYCTRATHRTYTPQFKAQLVAQCQLGGAPIAALATSHAMNANVLHRWLKEHTQQGRHQLENASYTDTHARPALSPTPGNPCGFIPVKLGGVVHDPKPLELKVELRKGALSMSITWPICCTVGTADFVQWSKALLQRSASTLSGWPQHPWTCAQAPTRHWRGSYPVFGCAHPHTAYLFANQRGNRIKVLVHDGIGIWLSARRLRQGKFVWAALGSANCQLERVQLDALVL